jgi:hypothetical protein
MTSYMPQSELEAIVAKHKHQWLEGMVTRNVMVINATEELRDRTICNFVREMVRNNIDVLARAIQ